jgi:hypothetical protein
MTTRPARYAVCIDDTGHEVSLEAGRVLPDARGEREGMLRVIDLPEAASRKLVGVERLRRKR